MVHSIAILTSAPAEPAWNMALDEALLTNAESRGVAVFRPYGWTEPAATFGYSQRYADVASATLLRPLIRRPTGGGIVPHDADWTYSLVVPPFQAWYGLRAIESYRAIHLWLQDAFRELGITTEIAPCCRKVLPGQCFAGHEQFDLLWGGRKIAGAAQRRNKMGLLIQGSVQPPPGPPRWAWENAMRLTVPYAYFQRAFPSTITEAEKDLATALVASKYGREEYNAGR